MGKDLTGRELGKGISQRKDGRYIARATVEGEPILLYGRNANQLKRDLKDEIETVKNRKTLEAASTIKSDITLMQWFEKWFENYKRPLLKETGIKSYRRKFVNNFGKKLGSYYLTELTQLMIQSAAREMLDAGISPRTVRESAGVLRQCLEPAVINGLIKANAAIGIVVPKDRAGDRRVLTNEEQDRFLLHVREKNNWYEELYNIMFLTGMRIGEIGALRWGNIDYEKQLIFVEQSLSCQYEDGVKLMRFTSPKTQNSIRTIPFFAETKRFLRKQQDKIMLRRKELGERWRNTTEFDDLVFYTSMGSPVARYNIQHDINNLVDEMNLMAIEESRRTGKEPKVMDRFHPHAIRHTFATRCFQKKMNPVVVQRMMGHANYNTTLSYTHVMEDMQREVADQVGSFLSETGHVQGPPKFEYKEFAKSKYGIEMYK
ncbi:site-specific integrase [Clostridiales Family XIII bacterium ASD5510]|uniref:Site-specific integrase n=1 Tax=Hominibacterium faecale TaxID=2839743 RepID=A0A9J6QTR5_9FIRM|nr:site-specific integrase [Hominibacterium faecale]MCU7378956.1 site-specific integrase [Hominibacterium faecale]